MKDWDPRAQRIAAITEALGLAAKVSRRYKATEEGPNQQEEERLRELAKILGIRIDIISYATKLLDAVDAVTPEYDAGIAPDKCWKKFASVCPQMCDLIVSDPKSVWHGIEMFLPDSEGEKDKVAWVKRLYLVICKNYKPSERAA